MREHRHQVIFIIQYQAHDGVWKDWDDFPKLEDATEMWRYLEENLGRANQWRVVRRWDTVVRHSTKEGR